MIGGNVIATVQVKTGTGKNAIGENSSRMERPWKPAWILG